MLRTNRAILIAVGAGVLSMGASVYAQTSPADEIEVRLAALEAPKFDAARRDDRAYVESYYEARREYMAARAALARELYEAAPDHPQVQRLMTERWSTLSQAGDLDGVLKETTEIAASDSPLATDAAYMHAQTFGQKHEWDMAVCGPVIDGFISRAPGDERGARLLYSAAQGSADSADQLSIYRRIVAEFPEARTTKYVPGKIRQIEGVGKPFELTFQDAVSGETVDLAAQRGKVLVIDFWATWCGPCIAEMPHMKELYAEYSGRGVQFIGVSLDQPPSAGGLEKLVAYVKENEVPWPQYYQGGGWESEFSTGWGVNAIPALFVVDHEGNLASTAARGQLEKLLPELIAKRDSKD